MARSIFSVWDLQGELRGYGVEEGVGCSAYPRIFSTEKEAWAGTKEFAWDYPKCSHRVDLAVVDAWGVQAAKVCWECGLIHYPSTYTDRESFPYGEVLVLQNRAKPCSPFHAELLGAGQVTPRLFAQEFVCPAGVQEGNIWLLSQTHTPCIVSVKAYGDHLYLSELCCGAPWEEEE